MKHLFLLIALSGVFGLPHEVSAAFTDEVIIDGIEYPVGVTFDGSGRAFVWEKAGRVRIVEEGALLGEPLLDISEEVGDWRDHGLLGFALDPDFLENGYFYVLYVVDRHHLLHFGTPAYSPVANEYFAPSIGRITRYTADVRDDFHSIVPDSRLVLVGESIDSGFPILHESHGIGSLVFGADGSLLATCGDGASYVAVDTGGTAGGSYGPQALADGIITEAQDVGSYRAQLVDALNGKMIRIDPATGDGLEDNPSYDAKAPRAARSRVWAMGFRNPFRATKRPGTGDAKNPGVFYVGDVGWTEWEELNIVDEPGRNYGWPIFEGLEAHGGYVAAEVFNLDAPNPLFDGGACDEEYFEFKDLIIQDTLDPDPAFPNPCDAGIQVPADVHHFVHKRAALDWGRPFGPTRTGIYDGLDGIAIEIDEPGSPVEGSSFGGFASVGGAWYDHYALPVEYVNTYFHGDASGSWIRNLVFSEDDMPLEVRDGEVGFGTGVVDLEVNPNDGSIWYVRYPFTIRRLTWDYGTLAPEAEDDFAEVTSGGSVVIDVLDNDSDADGALDATTVDVIDEALAGDISIDSVTGAVTYMHDGGGATSDAFTYIVRDGDGAPSNLATVFITIEQICDADLDGSGEVAFADLLILLAAWNTSDVAADLDGSGTVGFADLLLLLAVWGDCS